MQMVHVIHLLFLLLLSPAAETGYSGCFPETPTARQLAVNPGNYVPGLLTTTQCQDFCSRKGQALAGLTAGKICFCGMTTTQPQVAASACVETCVGEAGLKCGTNGEPPYDSVYTTPVVLYGFQIFPGDMLLETFVSQTLYFNLTTGNIQSILAVTSDGGPDLGPITTLSVPIVPRRSRPLQIKAKIIDIGSEELESTQVFKVQARIKLMTLVCPAYVTGNVQFDCFLRIGVGSAMTVNIDMNDGTKFLLKVPECREFSMGYAHGTPSTASHPGNNLYLFPDTIVRTNATLVGLDYTATTIGNIIVQVYRPSCGPGLIQMFCHKSYSCISVNESCYNQPRGSYWQTKCGPGTIYSLAFAKCINKTSGAVIRKPPITDWGQMPIQSFELVHEFTFTISTTGRNFYTVPDADLFIMDPADVIAIKEDGGRFELLDTSNNYKEFYWTVGGDWSTRATNGYSISSNGVNTLCARHAVQAYFAKPVRAKFRHTYGLIMANYMNISLTAYNAVTQPPVSSLYEIELLITITGVTIDAPAVGATNNTIQLSIPTHPGSQVLYTWRFGTADVMYSNHREMNYTWTGAGIYTIKLTAENKISSMCQTYVITIQDEIKNLTAEAENIATVFTEETKVHWNISKGTNVSYHLTMGDGVEFLFGYPFQGYLCEEDNLKNTFSVATGNFNCTTTCNGTSSGMDGHISYYYSEPDWFTFTITAFNLVGNSSVVLNLPVQIPISDFFINESSSIPFGASRAVSMTTSTGTHITHTDLQVSMNGSLLNMSNFDWTLKSGEAIINAENYNWSGYYIIEANITNLVSPVSSFERGVWIDFLITNMSIINDRPYVPVGENTTFNIGMDFCSRFNTSILYGDGSPLEFLYQDLLVSPQRYRFSHIFTTPGIYNVNLSIENPVDNHTSIHNVHVQYPVENVVAFVSTPMRLEQNGFVTVKVKLTFLGGVPLATDASFHLNFNDSITTTGVFEEPTFLTTETPTVEQTTGFDCSALYELLQQSLNSSKFDTNTTDTTPATITEEEYQLLCNNSTITYSSNMTTTTNPMIITPETVMEGFFEIIFSHNYTLYGTYNLFANISNLVDFEYLPLTLDIDEPIYDLEFIPDPFCISVRTKGSFIISMSWGSRAECTISIGDGSPDIVVPCNRSLPTSTPHYFNTAGVYYPYAVGNNTVSTEYVASPAPIIVQVPVDGFEVKCLLCSNDIGPPTYTTYNTSVMFELLFDSSKEMPTNASYTIDYGDGTKTSPQDMPKTFAVENHGGGKSLAFLFQHCYLRGGNYTVIVNIWNLVSNVNYTCSHDLYEAIVNLHLNFYDYDPDTGITKVGGGPDQNYFALEHQVLFVASHDRGSHVTYHWGYGDGSALQSIYYIQNAYHGYSEDSTFTITLNATNKFVENDANIKTTINIQRGCFNTSISVDDPRPKNSTFEYQMCPGTIGSDACYFIDFKDDTSVPSRYMMFGDSNSCASISEWSWYWNDPNKLFVSHPSDTWYADKLANPSNYNITIHNMFMFEGAYDVTLECKNYVSHTTAIYNTGVTKGQCWWPYVNLTSPNLCQPPACDTVDPNMRVVLKSEKLIVYSDVIINCTSTKVAYYSWTVFKINETHGNEVEVTELGDADVYSIGARYLQVEPRVLEYGLYRFELNVSMNELMGMFSVDSVELRILPTPLQVAIAGGDILQAQWGSESPLVLDGQTESYDPDVASEDKSGMEFIWLCRRVCENWPIFDNDFNPTSTFTHNCTYQDDSDRGCSKIDELDSPGKMVNATGGVINIFTGEMYEADHVEIRLIVRKGNRIAEDFLVLFIAEGNPPLISLKCVTNCGPKMNPTSRYSLQSHIDGWTRGAFFYYRWKLYGVPWGGGYFNRRLISESQWVNQATTGSNGPHMAIDPVVSLFTSNSSYSYYFSVKSWRWGTSESNSGITEINFRINEKPKAGRVTVSISPGSGIAYETKFSVSARGFTDYEDGSTMSFYKFGYRIDPDSLITWFHEGTKSNNYGFENPFPNGLESLNFQINVVVRAYDRSGAYAEKWKSITVQPPQPTAVRTIISTATEPGGQIDKYLIGADIRVAPMSLTLAKFLNEEANGALTSAEVVETTTSIAQDQNLTEVERLALEQTLVQQQANEKENRIRTRETLMNGFKRVNPSKVEAMQGAAAALAEMSVKEDELTATAQEDAASIMEDYVIKLKSQSSLSADDREDATSSLIATIGNTMHAAGLTAELAEEKGTQLVNMVETTADGTVSTTQATNLSPEEIKARQQQLLNEKNNAMNTFLRLEQSLNNIINTLGKYKVVGEKNAVIESPKLNVTLSKTETKDVNYNPNVAVGGLSGALLPKTQAIFGEEGNETTWFVETEALRMTNNPFTWTNASATTSSKVTSDVISLKFRNDTNDAVEVRDTPQYFDIFMDRQNFDTTVQNIINMTKAWNEPSVLHMLPVTPNSSLHITINQIYDKEDIQYYLDWLDYLAGISAVHNSTAKQGSNVTENDLYQGADAFYMETKQSLFYVFIKMGGPPSPQDHDYNCTLPKTLDEFLSMLDYMDALSYENDTSLPRSNYLSEIPDWNTCLFSNDELSLNETTDFYIAVKHKTYEQLEAEAAGDFSTTPLSVYPPATSTTTTLNRKRRAGKKSRGGKERTALEETLLNLANLGTTMSASSAGTSTHTNGGSGGGNGNGHGGVSNSVWPPAGAYYPAVYNISFYSASCVWRDRTKSVWSTDGCFVGPLSKPYRIHCLCNHLTAFGAGFAVPMNSLSLNDSGFAKLDENPVIFATMVSLMCVYVLMLIWARNRDLLDKVMAGSSPLPDNDPRDKYLYEMTVFTGSRKGSGTSANISFILTGEKSETTPRYLADNKRPVLQRSNCDGFIMATPKTLGKLTHLRIWHDNMGSSPSWYFSRLQVQDLQTGDKYFFICEQWLSVDDEDGIIDRMVPVAGKAELTSFNYLFWQKTKHNLADGHLWFSVFQRPVRSNFTRVQRLTCCLTLLFTTMVVSLAWYQTDTNPSPTQFRLGPVTLSLTGVYIGVVSGLMTFPINFIIVLIFRYSAPKPEKKKEFKFNVDGDKSKATNTGESKSMNDKSNHDSEKSTVSTTEYTEASLIKEKSELDPDFVELELRQQDEFLETRDKKKWVTIKEQIAEEDQSINSGQTQFSHNVEIVAFEKESTRKGKKRLPWRCVYLGYILSFITVVVAFYFAVEFGGVFGLDKSVSWLIGFIVSLFESIFFSQPIKVIIVAIFYALVIKRPEAQDEEYEQMKPDLRNDEEYLHDHLTEKDLEDPQKLRLLEQRKTQATLPPELDFLKTIRLERQKERAMFAMLKEIAVCMLFLYIVLTIAYANRDPWSHVQYKNYDNIFNKGYFARAIGNYSVHFVNIDSRKQFWNWSENALLQGLYNKEFYNGEPVLDKLIIDKQSILVGGARLRQLRVTPELCYSPINYFAGECMPEYDMFYEDQTNYKLRWNPVNDSDPTDFPHPFFSYQSMWELSGYPYQGIFQTYSGGGYVAELGTTLSEAQSVLNFLKDNYWIGKQTRAVFIEANIFNPNMNLWGISLYLCEFLRTGAIEPFPRMHVFRLDRYINNDYMYFVMAIEISALAFVIFYTIKEFKKIKEQGKMYFTQFWNIFELVILALSYAIGLVFIWRAVLCVRSLNKIEENPTSFVNMHFTVMLDDLSSWFIAFLVFFLNVRFLRLLRFNKKISLLSSTLQHSGKMLLSFSFVFNIAFLSFACTAYLFFMSRLFEFRSYIVTLETLLSMMLGKFDYEAAYSATRISGPLLFGFFSVCFSFILINFFLTILMEAFETVRRYPVNQSNEHEVIDYFMKRFKMLLGVGAPTKRKVLSIFQDPRLQQYVYIEGKTVDQVKLQELDERVEKVIKKMEGFVDCDDEIRNELEKEMEAVKKNRRRKIVIG
ncbi:uncharacterized protein LOC125649388 [Ostrea edulis]|uniref:uncharacterized protein LOC125649388 n=1 Tax=Ostrea edulis TaxID=37623 RepID=UPI0024AF79B3|nr:uncharacterized protein LOC125649388 [Ostrea edulis]